MYDRLSPAMTRLLWKLYSRGDQGIRVKVNDPTADALERRKYVRVDRVGSDTNRIVLTDAGLNRLCDLETDIRPGDLVTVTRVSTGETVIHDNALFFASIMGNAQLDEGDLAVFNHRTLAIVPLAWWEKNFRALYPDARPD